MTPTQDPKLNRVGIICIKEVDESDVTKAHAEAIAQLWDAIFSPKSDEEAP